MSDLEKRVTDIQMRKKVVVIGGATAAENRGRFFVKYSMVCYLRNLKRYFEQVVFCCATTPGQERLVSSEITSDIAKVIPLRFRSGEGRFRRTLLWLLDMPLLSQITRDADLILETFPAVGGIIGFMLLKPPNGKYALYFASQGERNIDRIATTGVIRHLLKINYWLSFKTEIEIADAIFVRDAGMVDELAKVNPKTYVSAPILSFPPPNYMKIQRDGILKSPRLIYVGRLIRGKGLEYLLESIAILHSKDVYATLDLFGGSVDIGYEMHLKEMTQRLGIDKWVTFHGWVDHPELLWSAYSNSDILVIPSETEGFPRVIDEASLASLPVVTTPVGGIGKTLKDGYDCIFIPVGNPHAIAEAIIRLAENPRLRERIVNMAKVSFRQRYPLDASAQHATLPFS